MIIPEIFRKARFLFFIAHLYLKEFFTTKTSRSQRRNQQQLNGDAGDKRKYYPVYPV
jgi:hypothetical protein